MPLLVLRPRHRAEDVRQRAARRQPDGVPAAVPAVHAAARRSSTTPTPSTASTWSRRSRPSRSRRSRRVPGVPARARDALAQRLQPARLPACRPDVYADRARGAGRVHHPAARGQRPRARAGGAGRTGSTRSSRSAASSPTGSGSTPCCAPPRSTSSGPARRSSPWWSGSGPHEAQVQMHDLAAELGLRRTYFLGPAASRTSWPRCSTAPTSAASPRTASRSGWCSSSAWPAARR